MPFENLPYINFHELNTDWMIEQLGHLNRYTEEAAASAVEAAAQATAAAQSVISAQAQADNAQQYAADAQEQAEAAAGSAQQAAEVISQVLDDIEDLREEVAQVEHRFINPYVGKTLHAFGDSNVIASYMDEKIPTKIKNALSMGQAFDHSANGACFQTGYGTQIISQVNSQSIDEDCALVLCIGGINDLHYIQVNVSDFKSAVSSFVTAAKNKYPNALIVMMFDSGSVPPNRSKLSYERALYEASQQARTICLPSADMCQDRTLWYNTNHYNAAGQNFIVSRLVTMLAGGVPSKLAPRNTKTVLSSSSPSLFGASNMSYNVLTSVDPYAMVRTDDIRVVLAANFDYTSSTVTDLCYIEACYEDDDEAISGTQTARTVYAGYGYSGGTGVIPMVYNANSTMNDPEAVPKIKLSLRFSTALTDVTGRYTTLYFTTRTGYTPAN